MNSKVSKPPYKFIKNKASPDNAALFSSLSTAVTKRELINRWLSNIGNKLSLSEWSNMK